MRLFHTVVPTCQTFLVRYGNYTYSSLYEALCIVLDIHPQGDISFRTPSECAAIDGLCKFYADLRDLKVDTPTFLVANLNTGKSILFVNVFANGFTVD